MLKKSLLSFTLFSAVSSVSADILTTVRPLGFISSAITEGVTHTQVLLPASASPHDYSLKPSDVEKLQSAQLVVWIGDEMETFLEKSIEKLPKAKVLTLEKIEAIRNLVESMEKEDKHHHSHDKHHHSHDKHHHDHDDDWHIWLSPIASETIAEEIAGRLSEIFPDQRVKIADNLAEFKAKLSIKHAEIEKQLSVFKDKGYYTFHDAYRYFEMAYQLKSLGSFTINPSIAPGAKTLAKIKQNLSKHKAQCLFVEPQFTPKVIESLSKGTTANVGQLDPLGGQITLGKDAYIQFLQALADQFSECLAK